MNTHYSYGSLVILLIVLMIVCNTFNTLDGSYDWVVMIIHSQAITNGALMVPRNNPQSGPINNAQTGPNGSAE